MEDFGNTLADSRLLDAGFEGEPFTWTNRRLWQRLDRALISIDWADFFGSTRIIHHPRGISDHSPLEIIAESSSRRTQLLSGFKTCGSSTMNYRGFGLGPEAAEAYAALDAMSLARSNGWRHIQLEGDCLAVKNKLKANIVDISPLGPLVHDILRLVRFFDSVIFSFVRRTGNAPAHMLARSARELLEGNRVLPPQALSTFLSDSI
ncbi:hypothetical protein BUALT_Bualt12G0086600 [Buddleja alternifolia]|uniref:RNase H type-1 domain-containing protein n=1 Tax=Buddleja alternifolia TaxID=168488 RepID=A0AAV6X0D5_9LAMI|nr:hypothetical protein BUALT_Bualt12G0086600 [Buddleja alternifolia]